MKENKTIEEKVEEVIPEKSFDLPDFDAMTDFQILDYFHEHADPELLTYAMSKNERVKSIMWEELLFARSQRLMG